MLEAQSIAFAYPHGKPVVEDFSLAVRPDELVALVAPSGHGKTTICRLLAGYEQPQTGSILVDGAPLPTQGVSPVQLIGQHPELTLNPLLAIERSLLECGPIPEDLLERFGVQERWLSRYPRELSGGELQRICIVRALAAKPSYLIADEISTMLDAITQANIWHELMTEAEARSMGIVFVSHSPALTQRIATRIIEL